MSNKAPSQPENAPQYTYKPTPYPEQDTVITSTTSSEAQEAPVPISATADATPENMGSAPMN